jgi:hypothetical protein
MRGADDPRRHRTGVPALPEGAHSRDARQVGEAAAALSMAVLASPGALASTFSRGESRPPPIPSVRQRVQRLADIGAG